MKNLVTGANGFLGSNLVYHLLIRNEQVIIMVRPTSNLRRLEDARDNVETRFGSLEDYSSLLRCLHGVDRLYHVAGNVRIGSFKKKELFRDNVTGSENIFAAALEMQVPEVIYVSSISILGSEREDVVNENDVGQGTILSTYGESKLAAYYAFKAASERGLNIRTAIPSNIFGPDDPNFGRLIKCFVQKRLKVIAGNLNANIGMIHVDSACEGIIQIAGSGRRGESYILNMENITLGQILMLAERITGIRTPRFTVPKPIVQGAAILADVIGSIVRKEILLNRQSARLLYTTHPVFDSSKAQRELNWKPAPFEKSFSEVIKWYQEKYERRKA